MEISAYYLVPDVACVLQHVGHSNIQILKCHYRGDFVRRLIGEGSCVRNFKATFISRLLYFSVAHAWNAFKSVRRVWRRL